MTNEIQVVIGSGKDPDIVISNGLKADGISVLHCGFSDDISKVLHGQYVTKGYLVVNNNVKEPMKKENAVVNTFEKMDIPLITIYTSIPA